MEKREYFEKKMRNFLYRLAIFMTLHDSYLNNPSTDSVILLHMERPYTGAMQ